MSTAMTAASEVCRSWQDLLLLWLLGAEAAAARHTRGMQRLPSNAGSELSKQARTLPGVRRRQKCCSAACFLHRPLVFRYQP